MAKDGAVPLYFQVASGNVADDQNHRATWDLLCRLTGRRDFLYAADCELASAQNMAHIHQRQGRFLTVLPRTRSEDGAFRELLGSGQIQWRHIHDKRNDNGEIVDKYSISEQASLSVEGYRLIWYLSTRKAEQDSHARHQQVERALIELSELRLKLSSPRMRFRQEAKVADAIQEILGARVPRIGLSRRSRSEPRKSSVRTGAVDRMIRRDTSRRRALASSWCITSITKGSSRKRRVTESSR